MGSAFLLSLAIVSAAQSPDFHVSPDGDDRNPGTRTRPFATLGRARDAVRPRLARMNRDIVVLLAGGQYYLDHTVEFGPADSGRNGHRVIYESAPGRRAVLVGGRRVTRWRAVGGGVYASDLPVANEFHQLFEDGVRQTKARHPNTGYAHSATGKVARPATQFRFEVGALPRWDDTRGAQAFVWAGADWFSATRPLASIDWDTRTVTLDGRTHVGSICWRQHRRFYVQGIRAALDVPGEFWRDPDSGGLHYMPRRAPVRSRDIVVPTTRRIVSFVGSSPDERVTHITFRNVAFTVSKFGACFVETRDGTHGKTPWNEPANKDAAVYLEHADDITIERCRITNAGYSGVSIVWSGMHNRIEANEIAHCGFHGVLLSGYRAQFGRAMDVNRDNVIRNNWIHHPGRLVGHGACVFVWASGHNRIEHNRMHDSPRYGVCVKGQRWAGTYGKGRQVPASVTVTRDNHWDFVHSRNNVIAHNDIFRVSQDSEDNGFISFWGTGKDNVIDHNLLHDIGPRRLGGLAMAVYLDDAADYTRVTNNVVYNIDSGATRLLVFAKGIHNTVENNILVGDERTRAAVRTHVMAGEPVEHHVYRRNIIVLDGGASVYWFRKWSKTKVDTSDYNVIYHPRGTYALHGGPAKTWKGWCAYDGGKYDRHSVLADPRFVDAASHDYRLRPGSPALKLGFEPIDVEHIGLLPGFPFAVE